MKQYWDPTGEHISDLCFEKTNQVLRAQIPHTLKKPRAFMIKFWLLFIPPLAFAAYIFMIPGLLSHLFNLNDGMFLALIPIAFVPSWLYYRKVRGLEKDMIKFLVAKENGWCFNSERRDATPLVTAYKAIFENFRKNHKREDEFWGQYKYRNTLVDFYAGTYTCDRSNSPGDDSNKTYISTIFAVKLPKTLNHRFKIISKHFLNIKYDHKELKTESSKFNKHFEVLYKETDQNSANEIINSLSPAVIHALTALKNKRKYIKILFQENTVVFVFSGHLIPKYKTNFIQKAAISPKDKKQISETINQLLTITGGIIKYLD